MPPVDNVLITLQKELKSAEESLGDSPIYKRIVALRHMLSTYSPHVTGETPKAVAAPAPAPRRNRTPPHKARPAATVAGKLRGRPPNLEKIEAVTKAAETVLLGAGGGPLAVKDILAAVSAAGISVSKTRPIVRLQQILDGAEGFVAAGNGYGLKSKLHTTAESYAPSANATAGSPLYLEALASE
jgi:hypothetical protein